MSETSPANGDAMHRESTENHDVKNHDVKNLSVENLPVVIQGANTHGVQVQEVESRPSQEFSPLAKSRNHELEALAVSKGTDTPNDRRMVPRSFTEQDLVGEHTCPICYRTLAQGITLCAACFGGLSKSDELTLGEDSRALVNRRDGVAGLSEAFSLAARFMVLDREAIEETARFRRYAPVGALVTGIGIAGSLAPTTAGAFALAGLTAFKYAAIYLPAVIFTHILARAVGGKGEYGQLLRAFHLTNFAYGVGLIPIVGPALLSMVALWDLVVSTYVLMVVHKISATKAVWVQLATIAMLVGAFIAFPFLGI